jgi:hypothetical protein
MSRVVVVGAGIAGLACARELASAGVTVAVRERSASVGGRMASPLIDGRAVDCGASYFTARDLAFCEQVQDWCARGLARPWTDRFPVATTRGVSEPSVGPWRYAAPAGLSSLVADIGNGIAVQTRSPVSGVGNGPSVDGEFVDAVVLALPDPQARRLLDRSVPEARGQVTARRWEPVFALAARYPQRSWPDIDGAFVADDDTLSWVADDGRRRGDDQPVLVAHSTTSFATGEPRGLTETAAVMAEAVDTLLGCGPPTAARVWRWPYARPAEPRDEPYFLGAERIGLVGDGWGSPRVETAWLSGRGLGKRLARELVG